MTESATTEIRSAPDCSDCAVWSTDAMRAHERLSYWRDVVCRAVFGVSIEASPERFTAWMSARRFGSMRFATAEAPRYELARTRREIGGTPDDHFTIYLVVHGQIVTTLGDEVLAVNPNEIGFYDGRRPLRSQQEGRRSMAVVPRAMIERRAPWMVRPAPRKLAANSPYTDLARRHLAHLTDCDNTLSDSAVSVLTENLCNLVALATATDIALDRLQPELQLEALLAFCRRHLHEVELSPQRAADHLGISVRTLHLRFRQTGQSFSRWVLANRLEACREALSDANQMTSNISEIAYRWGFNDLSHFNRAFRARFDMSPREWRHVAEASRLAAELAVYGPDQRAGLIPALPARRSPGLAP